MPYKTHTEDVKIVQAWRNHPFWWPYQIAESLPFKCVNTTALARYPYPREIGHIRRDQAVHAINIFGALPNKELERLTGISDNTFIKAKQWINGIYKTDVVDKPIHPQGLDAEIAAYCIVPEPVPEPDTQVLTRTPLADTPLADTLRDRGQIYGHPLDNFRNIAEGSKIIAQCPDVEVRVALDMIWVKVCRLLKTPDHIDSIHDIAGYAGTIEMLLSERKRRS